MHNSPSLFVAAVLTAAAPLGAQTPSVQPARAVRLAVESITATDFRECLSVIADDSMRGRATPSPGLEHTAAYIADAFRRLGLRPGGDGETYFQRYPLIRTQFDSGAALVARVGDVEGRWLLGRDVLHVGVLPEDLTGAPIVVMTGIPADTIHPFGAVDVRGAVVFSATSPSELLRAAATAGARVWVHLLNVPTTEWTRDYAGAPAPQFEVPGLPSSLPVPILFVGDSAAGTVLAASGAALATLRDTSHYSVRMLPGATVGIAARVLSRTASSEPNVIGVLEGSDEHLRDEYVLITAHMDHLGAAGEHSGCAAQVADSICNGADDNGSGTAGVVMLAQAFARLSPRPRRTLIFMTVSGEEQTDSWGSGWWASHPTHPVAQVVANLNLDAIGRNSRDMIGVVGKEFSTLGDVTDRVTREHPELGMRLVASPEDERFYMQSDNYSFAQRGVPAVWFFSGFHPELHTPKDEVDMIDAEKTARVLRMIFYVTLELANAAERPQWAPMVPKWIVSGEQS